MHIIYPNLDEINSLQRLINSEIQATAKSKTTEKRQLNKTIFNENAQVLIRPVAEDTTYSVTRRRNSIGSDLETSSLLANFLSSRRCCIGCEGKTISKSPPAVRPVNYWCGKISLWVEYWQTWCRGSCSGSLRLPVVNTETHSWLKCRE